MKEKIEAILVKYDPVKLIKMGAPQDEYSSEAQMIYERTTRHFALEKIHDIVYQVFVNQFGSGASYRCNENDEMILIGEDIAPRDVTVRIIGRYEDYKVIANEIKELLEKENTQAT